jgi:hypothetical protein
VVQLAEKFMRSVGAIRRVGITAGATVVSGDFDGDGFTNFYLQVFEDNVEPRVHQLDLIRNGQRE